MPVFICYSTVPHYHFLKNLCARLELLWVHKEKCHVNIDWLLRIVSNEKKELSWLYLPAGLNIILKTDKILLDNGFEDYHQNAILTLLGFYVV